MWRVQSRQKKFVLGCVIPPLARERITQLVGQTFLANCVVTFYLQTCFFSLECKLDRSTHGKEHRASHNPSNTIFYWLPLSIAGRNLRSSL